MRAIEFDPNPLRAQFPSLSRVEGDRPLIYFDNPGGTQVPGSVIDAVARYYTHSNANSGGSFATSRRTDAIVRSARSAMADLLNAAGPDEIVFGPNMTSLTFHLARSIAGTIVPGDEIIVTNLEHDANVSPWTDMVAVGAKVRFAPVCPETGTLPADAVVSAFSDRTRLVAVTGASNAIGTIPDVQAITRAAHEVGALVFVDAVQYAPHGPIDVQALDCDFLACSAYKFFGPHVGILYGKRESLQRFTPHKVRPAPDEVPCRWETGTLNHEGLAGMAAAVDYLTGIGAARDPSRQPGGELLGVSDRRLALRAGMCAIKEYEKVLCRRLIAGLSAIDGLRIYGITDPTRFDERVPTVTFTWTRLPPRATAEYLAKRGICVWSGNYYALRLMEQLGLEASGGAVRVGLVHYNTVEEIDTLLDALRDA